MGVGSRRPKSIMKKGNGDCWEGCCLGEAKVRFREVWFELIVSLIS